MTLPGQSALMPRVEAPCQRCGTVRRFVAENAAESGLCKSCGIKASWEKKGIPRITREDKAAYNRGWYQRNKSGADANCKAWKDQKRTEVITLLGGKCVRCGITDPIVLNIDHVNNDGAEERRLTKRGFTGWLARIADGTLSKERYQLLCCNCNWRKEYLRRKCAQLNS